MNESNQDSASDRINSRQSNRSSLNFSYNGPNHPQNDPTDNNLTHQTSSNIQTNQDLNDQTEITLRESETNSCKNKKVNKLLAGTEGIESLSERSAASVPSSGMIRLNTELHGLADQQRRADQSDSPSIVNESRDFADNELQITEKQWQIMLEQDEEKRKRNVKEEFDNFLRYFYYHFFFFAWFATQNYFFVGTSQHFQYCFLVLVFFYLRFIYKHICELADKEKMKKMGKWLRPRLYLKILEHLLIAINMFMIPLYLLEGRFEFSGWYLLVPLIISAIINLFLVKYDASPCNSTFQLTVKTVLFLRLVVAANIILKAEGDVQWEWSTAFWPYWCSFTIQAVIVIATLVIFLNTVGLFFRHEATKDDILGSLWGTLMSSGFMLSTLQPVIEIIKIYDFGANIPDELLENPQQALAENGSGPGSEFRWYLSESERYSLEMQTYKRNMIPFLIVIYPMVYCLLSVVISTILKESICNWFESVLYMEELEESRASRINSEIGDDNMLEHTINSEEEEEVDNNGQQRRPVKLKTYNFKKPQFLKKLTNTYFKKTKNQEKAVIFSRELVTQKLTYQVHKKNTKSISGNLDGVKKSKMRPFQFSEDMLDSNELDNSSKQGQYDRLHLESINLDSQTSEQKLNSDSQDSLNLANFLKMEKKSNRQKLGYETEDIGQIQTKQAKNGKKQAHSRFKSYTQMPKYANPETVKLEEEQKRGLLASKEFRDKHSCCICFDNLADAVIMNCGHGGICYECGKSILESDLRLCHLCREPLVFILQMDLAYAYNNMINVVSATYVEESEEEEVAEKQEQEQWNAESANPSPSPIEIQNQSIENPNTHAVEDQSIDIGELVSFRQDDLTLPEGEVVENGLDLFGDQSMEFDENQGQVSNNFPFDCSQFYLQQQSVESYRDTEQELIVSGRNSQVDIQTPQNSGQKRFILFQKQPSSQDKSLDMSKESSLRQVKAGELIADRKFRKLSMVPSVNFSEESRERLGGHRRSKTRQISLSGVDHSQDLIPADNQTKNAEKRRQLVRQYFARQSMADIELNQLQQKAHNNSQDASEDLDRIKRGQI